MSFSSRAFCQFLASETASTNLSLKTGQEEKTTIMCNRDGVLHQIAKRLGYDVDWEFLRIDQVWSYPVGDNIGFRIDAYIEHENLVGTAHQEIVKLMHPGPGLKVLITYGGENSFENWKERFGQTIAELFGFPQSQHLLLVMCDLEHENGTLWGGYEFD